VPPASQERKGIEGEIAPSWDSVGHPGPYHLTRVWIYFPCLSLSLFFLVLFLYIIICIEVSFGGCNPYPHHSKFHFALLFIPQFFFQPGPRCSEAAMDHKKLTRTGSWEHVVGYIPGIKINTWSDRHWSLKMV
jgi:hypothetical protein